MYVHVYLWDMHEGAKGPVVSTGNSEQGVNTASTNVSSSFAFNNLKAFRITVFKYLAGGRRNADGICSLKIRLVFYPDWKIAVDLDEEGKRLRLGFRFHKSLRISLNFLIAILRPPTLCA